MGRILIVLVALITMGTTANASTLAGGAISGGSNQAFAACLLFNNGTAPITITGTQIIQQGNISVKLTDNNCGTPPSTLAAGAICFILAAINIDTQYGCKFAFTPTTTAVTGTLELATSAGVVLATTPLLRN